MMSKEQYENLIVLLENVLKYYADESNYMVVPESESILRPKPELRRPSGIEIDNGSQARFAINKIKELRETMDSAEDEYNRLIKESRNMDTPDSIQRILNKLKQG